MSKTTKVTKPAPKALAKVPKAAAKSSPALPDETRARYVIAFKPRVSGPLKDLVALLQVTPTISCATWTITATAQYALDEGIKLLAERHAK